MNRRPPQTNLTLRSFDDVSAYQVLTAKSVAVSRQLPTYPGGTEQHEHPIEILLLSCSSLIFTGVLLLV